MKTERRLAKSCLIGLLSIVLVACSGSDGDGNTSGNGSGASGGAATGGAASFGGGTATGKGGGTATSTGGGTAAGKGGGTATSAGGGTATGKGGGTATSTGGATSTGTGGSTAAGKGGATSTGTGGTTIGVGGTTSGTGGSAIGTGGSTTGTAAVKVLLAGTDVNADGPLKTTVQENLSFSGGGHILVRPTDITKEPNTKHPVAIWGPGGGTPPKDYLMLLKRMASQGFVVVGIRESSGGSELMSAAIDWLEKQNSDSSSPMYDRLILNRVGVFGHSMGGLSSEATALVDPRVTTALMDNSGAFSHDQLVKMKVPVGIIYGENGMERPNAEGDYNNSGNKAPCWLGMMAGGGHGSGPWDGAGANVAWMRWHIGGENSRKNAFLGSGGDYNNRGIWTTKSKNWDSWKNWNE
jgi:hypothetical protein